jgi:hypothetical protein
MLPAQLTNLTVDRESCDVDERATEDLTRGGSTVSSAATLSVMDTQAYRRELTRFSSMEVLQRRTL